MKPKNLLQLLIVPLLIGATPINPSTRVTISTNQIGPYDLYQDDVESSYLVSTNSTRKISVYERIMFNDLKTDNTRYITTSSHTISSSKTVTMSLNIPTSEFMGPNGMQILITVYNASSNEQYTSDGCIINPPGQEIINPLQYLNNGYTTNTTAYRFPNRDYDETLTFPNFNDYFLTDIYYKIDLTQFDITVSGRYDNIPLGTGTMTLKDAGMLFPYFPRVANNVTIDLIMFEINGNYRIKIKKTLYVDPLTLNMSPIPITGYLATDNFYFPINQMSNMQGLEIAFVIKDFGNNQTNLSWSSTYYPTSSLIGPCNSSEYCVVGGVSQ